MYTRFTLEKHKSSALATKKIPLDMKLTII